MIGRSRFSLLSIAAVALAAIATLFVAAEYPRSLAAQGYSNAIPTISSGFGTGPSVTAGTVGSFRVNVGTGGAASAGVIAMNFTAPTGWNCAVNDLTAAAANTAAFVDRQTASTATTVSVVHQTLSTGAVLVYTASDILTLNCTPF